MKPFTTAIISLLICYSGNAEPSSVRSETKSHPLVASLDGDLPIILSAPHGGRNAVPDVPARQGKGVKKFVAKPDTDTDLVTEELATAIAKITGNRPYVVISRFERKFIDANRAPESAYETEQAKATYDAYQQAITAARQKIIVRWGSGILLDVHGQTFADDTVFRGTQNGKTVAHLIKKFGAEAYTGEKSLFGQLAKQGFTVAPPIDSQDDETEDVETRYAGGHIVQTYGSANGDAFDAIQIELGTNLRLPAQRAQTVGKLARAITAFANDFLPKKEIANKTSQVAEPPKKIKVGVYHCPGSGRRAKDWMATPYCGAWSRQNCRMSVPSLSVSASWIEMNNFIIPTQGAADRNPPMPMGRG